MCCCVSNFIRRGKTSRGARETKKISKIKKKDNKSKTRAKTKRRFEILRTDSKRDERQIFSKTRAKNTKGDSRFYERQQTRRLRQIFERKQTQFFTPFSKCSASIAVLKIHDKPLPYYWEKQTEKTFSSHGGHFAIDPPTKRSPFSDETKDDATHFVNAIYFFEFFVFFFARTEADGVLLSKMGIHPRGEERW